MVEDTDDTEETKEMEVILYLFDLYYFLLVRIYLLPERDEYLIE